MVSLYHVRALVDLGDVQNAVVIQSGRALSSSTAAVLGSSHLGVMKPRAVEALSKLERLIEADQAVSQEVVENDLQTH